MLRKAAPLAALLLASLVARTASAGPLAPTKPSQLASVRAVSQPCPQDNPNDTATWYAIDQMTDVGGNQIPFVIPPKQVFVITHVHLSTGNATANAETQLYLLSVPPTGDGGVLTEMATRTGADGRGHASVDLPTGIPVRSGTTICAAGGDGGIFGSVTGFFAKDK